MDLIEYTDKFLQPVVDDEVLRDPILTLDIYKDLLAERNAYELCAWAKCGNKVADGDGSKAIFCSKKCQGMSNQFAASFQTETPGPIGKVVERFTQQKPPKPLKRSGADWIEGFRVRVGPYRNQLNEVEKWFGGFRIVSFTGMNKEQRAVFTCVNEQLKVIGAQLKPNSMDVSEFFVNINVKDPSVLLEAPTPFKMGFALAIYEYLVGAEVRQALGKLDVPVALYDDLLEIILQTDEGDF